MGDPTPAPRKPSIDAALVYDGDCAFCTRSVGWVKRRFKRLPYITPWQEADLDRLGLTARQCHDALQWVDYRGTFSGAQAVGRLLQAQGGLWRLVAWLPFFWPFSSMAEGAYGLVAKNRYRLPGGTAACAAPERPDSAELESTDPSDSTDASEPKPDDRGNGQSDSA
jgi:predicted DCC family thiol-disulfide oxidoreductase YuxK